MGLCRNFTQYTFRQGGRLNDNPRPNTKDLKPKSLILNKKNLELFTLEWLHFRTAPLYIMHSVLEQSTQWQKQYIAIGKTDLFNNSMGPCENFIHLNKPRKYFYVL